jgi:uncharacterized membrane protein
MRFVGTVLALNFTLGSSAFAATPTYSLQLLQSDANDPVSKTQANAISPRSAAIVGQSNLTSYSTMRALQWPSATPHELPKVGVGANAAVAVNDVGQVVGSAQPQANLNPAPVQWNPDGSSSWLQPLEALTNAFAVGIDNTGHAYGYGYQPSVNGSSLLPIKWTNGVAAALPFLPGSYQATLSSATAAGWTAGTSWMNDGTLIATLWTSGKPSAFGPIGQKSRGYAVNKTRQAVGSYLNSSEYEIPFVDNNGAVTELPRLNPPYSYARPVAINDTGVIAGYSTCTRLPGGMCGVVWRNGKIADLNDLLDASGKASGWTVTQVVSLDQKGRMLAFVVKGAVRMSALLTPH